MTHSNQMRWLIVVVCLVFLPACTGRSADQPKADLTGEYRIVGGERNGAPIEQNELNNAAIIISDTTIIAYDKERKEMFAATYTLETQHTPWQITMISTKAPEVGQVAKGLIRAEQDKIKLVYALPNGRTPTDFQAGEQQQMFVLAKIDAALPDDATAPAGT
ncbi:MAG: hypothetical protein Nkreftii_002215 [Candidatus Nitrospira kreftii]|uniref:Lipoprotein n=1 Tax=Candidatus Nitrospira kreftii TaxID=2652173 RepID=A0A7S8IZN5_9BACT|nr:MAG: hypothetical protein Nkreftii_002215 [Candidatus Nitrospira kreftii]